MNKFAVIDLGSNTFHILITEISLNNQLKTLYKERVFIGLSEGGIEIILQHNIKKGLATLMRFKGILQAHGNPELRVIGTAVLRNASNRHEFITQAEIILGTSIQIIDGIKEADYIFKGIMLLPDLHTGTHLIMDIGGGSTEFILVENGTKSWSASYPLGVGVLHHKFHHLEPIGSEELIKMKDHVLETLKELTDQTRFKNIEFLSGASGSFEILESMSGVASDGHSMNVIEADEFLKIYEKIIYSDFNQRKSLPGLPEERVKLIVVGMALKKIIIDAVRPNKILVSPYALKEGVLFEMLQNSDHAKSPEPDLS